MINKIKSFFNKIFRRDKTKYYFVSGFTLKENMNNKIYFDIHYVSNGLLNRKELNKYLIKSINDKFGIDELRTIYLAYYKKLTKEEYEEFIK